MTLLEVLSCIGQAATTGVRQGDYLSHVNGWAVPGLEGDLDEAVSRMGAERPLRLRFRAGVATRPTRPPPGRGLKVMRSIEAGLKDSLANTVWGCITRPPCRS